VVFEDAVDDVRVAAVAGGCTVALTLLLRVGLGRSVGTVPLLVPLVVYVAYLVVSRRDPPAPFDAVRTWVGVTLAASLATLVAVLAV
jgi:hypothetical protein